MERNRGATKREVKRSKPVHTVCQNDFYCRNYEEKVQVVHEEQVQEVQVQPEVSGGHVMISVHCDDEEKVHLEAPLVEANACREVSWEEEQITSLTSVNKMTSSVESSFATATEMFKEVFERVAKERQEMVEEKQKWEKEKESVDNKFIFNGPKIVLDVGGVHYSTSRSTLTKYPESMLGVMFSGRHDLESMQCKDGSFFIDRDGTHFCHILNYLRDGEEVVESIPNSVDVLSRLVREAKFYQLEGLVSVLVPLLREIDVVNQNKITSLFSPSSGSVNCYSDCETYSKTKYEDSNISYRSKSKIVFKHKNMRGLSFNRTQFAHAVSFIDCDLTNATFQYCSFESDVIFENCILDNTMFNYVKGLVTDSWKVSFTGSKTDMTRFDGKVRSSLKSSGKIS